MWNVGVVLMAHIVFCQFTTEDQQQNLTTTETLTTVTTFYALSSPAPIMLRLGNSTLDSSKSFKVPQAETSTHTNSIEDHTKTNENYQKTIEDHRKTNEDRKKTNEDQKKTNEAHRKKEEHGKVEDHTKTPTAKSSKERVMPEVIEMSKHKVPNKVGAVRNTHFDHDKRLGPTFEDSSDSGNVTRVTVQLGEDAHLNCRISLLQDKTVSWVRRKGKDENLELLTVGAVTYAADGRVSVGKRYPGNWRLLVKDVKPDDEGIYECQISTHPPRVSRIYLHVNTPEVWVVDEAGNPLLEKYYEAESTLALVCRARHVETPAVLTWLHEGRALNADTTRGGINVKTEQVPGGADSLLRLARVNSSDAGNYTCAVRGARAHTVAVHVLNEESLAELHAAASHHLSSKITIFSLIIPLIILKEHISIELTLLTSAEYSAALLTSATFSLDATLFISIAILTLTATTLVGNLIRDERIFLKLT